MLNIKRFVIFVKDRKPFLMNKTTRILVLLALLTGQMFASFADRGVGRKKSRVVLNIKSPSAFSSTLNFNLRNGMRFTGSLMNFSTLNGEQSNIVTYRKGNSVYIIPYKQKILVADVRQGFAGTKLIIKVP